MSTIVSVTDREKVVVTIGDAEVAREVAEVAAEAEAELDVQEEAEEMKAQEEEPEAEMAITITISAVLTYKVLTAKTRSDVLNTGLWLMCGIFFAGAAVVALLAIGVALQWPRCFDNAACQAGTVCISLGERNRPLPDYRDGNEGFKDPVCQDCYFLAQTGGVLSAPDDLLWQRGLPAVGLLFGTDNKTASEICLDTLDEHSSAIKFASSKSTQPADASFARCLYVQETLGLASHLDWFVLQFVFLLVALLLAEDQRQQQLICRLRRILLPLPLRPKKKTTGSALRWLGTLLVTTNEFIISLAAPLLPFGVIFLMLTQGIGASSALLNGLAMGFVLQIDDFVPSIFLSPKVLTQIETYLVGEAVREMAKKDAAGFYGYVTASPFIALATVVMAFITQLYVLNASRSVNCWSVFYLLHYRATIFFGLWCTGVLCLATEAGTRAIIGSSRTSIIVEDTPPAPSAIGVPKWVAPVLSMLVHALTRRIVYLLTAAFTLNCVLFVLVVEGVLEWDAEDEVTKSLWTDFIFDLFGTCARGYGLPATGCVPF